MLKPRTIALAGLVLACLPAHAQVNFAVRYLDCEAGDDANDGKTAATAKRTLQGALAGIPDGCHRPVEVHVLPGRCRVERASSPGPVLPPTSCAPLPESCTAVGLWPDTRLLGAGSETSSILGTAEAPVLFTDRPECTPGGPRLVLQDLTLDLTDDQGIGIVLPRRDALRARGVDFVNETSVPGPVRVAISDSWFSAGLGVGPANGYIRNTGFGGNEINDANTPLLSVTVRPGGKLVVSDSQLESGYFFQGAVARCADGGGVLVLEHNTFSLPPDGALTVGGSTGCEIHVLRNRFTYASYWDDPGLGVQVLFPSNAALTLSGNTFDGYQSDYTALSVAPGSNVVADVAYNTFARSVLDAITLPDDGSGHVRIRGNAFYAIDGAAIRVEEGGQKPELSFNNFDTVGDALCLGSTCFATGQAVDGSGAGGGNRDFTSEFQSVAVPGDFHLTAASPLIDAADPQDVTPRRDQDGRLRPVDGDGDAQAVCDIGAFEFLPPPPGLGRDALRPKRAR